MTTIKINPLSRKSIDDARYMLLQYKESVKAFPELYMKALTERFEEILGEQAPPMADGTWSSYIIHGDDGKASGIIVFDQKVEFIEFGTGVVGKQNHGGINEEWLKRLPPPYTEYNAGPRIHHFQDENMDYWVYFDNGNWVVTHGIAADPFIYRSVQKLMTEHGKVAREVFAQNHIGSDFRMVN